MRLAVIALLIGDREAVWRGSDELTLRMAVRTQVGAALLRQ